MGLVQNSIVSMVTLKAGLVLILRSCHRGTCRVGSEVPQSKQASWATPEQLQALGDGPNLDRPWNEGLSTAPSIWPWREAAELGHLQPVIKTQVRRWVVCGAW